MNEGRADKTTTMGLDGQMADTGSRRRTRRRARDSTATATMSSGLDGERDGKLGMLDLNDERDLGDLQTLDLNGSATMSSRLDDNLDDELETRRQPRR
ncbi:hypothetical protein KFK09_022488 [Dendrobium nobile]|uniref:Uncharacterized protein n=1 Tax=Dendrobium nobile TaxID=94219 RepID=A0A8T3AJH7_DENNO|nr:hypothetical protein KFK09_022488 [Dendrobium nobile]